MYVTVIGAGRMGAAIAHIFASANFDIDLIETNSDVRETVESRLREIEVKGESKSDILQRIHLRETLNRDIARSSLVIEAVSEKLALKQDLFAELDQICDPETILASNTSVIPITKIGEKARHRERILGTHFWNPPYIFRLVEVVQTAFTVAESVAKTIDILRAAGQEPVHIRKDVPGFVGNRLQHALKREAIALVEAGVCDAETIDFVVKNSFGPRLAVLGPLEQSDLVGLDLTLAIHDVLLQSLDCSRSPQRLLVDLVAAGKTGMKVGEGFRHWTAEDAENVRKRLHNYKPTKISDRS